MRSEVAIVCQLARTLLGPDHPVPWEKFNDDYDQIRDAIAAVVPGCDDYNTKVRQPDGFQLPHPPRDSREFPTSTGKANFALNPLEWVPVPEGRLVLQTLRSHDQYNTTIYGLDDRYRGVKGGRRVVFVNPADIEAFGLTDGDRVDLVSEFTDGDGQLQERTRQGLHGGGVLDAGRQCGGLLPGDQFACAAGSHRGQVEYAGVQGDRHPIGTEVMGRVTARRRASHVTADDAVTRPETLVVEEPLEIRVNGNAVTVTMRTPGSDVELAQGFLLTEGVIGHRDDLLTVRYCKGTGPDNLNTYNVLDATLAPGVKMPRGGHHPQLLHDVVVRGVRQGVPGRGPHDQPLLAPATTPHGEADTLSAMPEQLRAEQKVFASTGGLHGAALFDVERRRARRARGHRQAQRRRQGHRLGRRTGQDPADGHRAAGQRPRVVRAHAEGGDGRHPGARGRVRAVVARGRSGQPVRPDPGGVPARRVDERLHPAGQDRATSWGFRLAISACLVCRSGRFTLPLHALNSVVRDR